MLTIGNLPEDILLHVLDVGEFDAADALALRWTCRGLYDASRSRSFWCTILRSVERSGLPLDLAPWRARDTLTADELMRASLRRIRSIKNLGAPSPQYKQHRTIHCERPSAIDASNHIVRFLFLSGGSLGLVVHLHGTVQIWDLKSDVRVANGDIDGVQVPQRNDTIATRVGRLLATYNVGLEIAGITYGRREDEACLYTVAVLGENPESGVNFLSVFALLLDSDLRNVKVVVYCHRLQVTWTGPYCLNIFNDLVVFVTSPRAPSNVQITVLDYIKGGVVRIDTQQHALICSLNNSPLTYEVILSESSDGSNDLVACTYENAVPKSTSFHLMAYYNINSHLPHEPNVESCPLIPHSMPPNAIHAFTIHSEEEELHDMTTGVPFWEVNWPFPALCMQGTVISVIGRYERLAGSGGLFMESLVWTVLDTRALLNLLRQGKPIDSSSVSAERCFIPLPSQNDVSIATEFSIQLGTAGRYVLWITSKAADDPPRCLLLELPTSGDRTGWSEPRQLDLPVDLRDFLALDWSDEASTLVGVSGQKDPQHQAPIILHFFEY